jgi:hypothetical protein
VHARLVVLEQQIGADRRWAARLPDSLEALERAAATSVDDGMMGEWQLDVATALARAEIAWRAHVRCDARPDSLVATVRRDVPRLAHEIDLELAEHEVFTADLRGLREALFGIREPGDLPAVRRLCLAVVGAVARHADRGDCLAFDAVNDEFGTGD